MAEEELYHCSVILREVHVYDNAYHVFALFTDSSRPLHAASGST